MRSLRGRLAYFRECVEHARNGARRQWLAQQVTLDLRAALGLHGSQLIERFDALGRGRNSQGAAKSSDGAHDRHRLGTAVQVANERLIDLDLVERKFPQIAQ